MTAWLVVLVAGLGLCFLWLWILTWTVVRALDALADLSGPLRVLDGRYLDRGAIVAVGVLTDCRRTEGLLGLTDMERLLGNFEPGRWAWFFESVRPLGHAVPCRGHQGFWLLDEATEAAVAAETMPF